MLFPVKMDVGAQPGLAMAAVMPWTQIARHGGQGRQFRRARVRIEQADKLDHPRRDRQRRLAAQLHLAHYLRA